MADIRRIAILTSGGDASGMNNAVIAVANAARKQGITPFLVYEGYQGLVDGNYKEVTNTNLNRAMTLGGTFIYSARLPEFKDEEVRKEAIEKLEMFDIDALVVIGGDGSYMGAAKLKEMGVQTIALPGTIDNDIALTDFTIGFHTASANIVDAIDKIRDTAESHSRAIVVEVMGRYCGDLAITAAIATGAEVLSVPERKLTEDEIIDQVKEARFYGKRAIIVIVTEHMYDVDALSKRIEAEAEVESRATVLGHLQRGGTPAVGDRVLASRMGVYAVERLLAGETGVAVGIVDNKLTTSDIYEVVEGKNGSRDELLKQYDFGK